MLSNPEILFQNDMNLFVKPKGRNVNPPTPRPEGLGLPFDKFKAPSTAGGLSLPAGRQGLTLSGASLPCLKSHGLPSTRAQAEGAPPNGSTPGQSKLKISAWRARLKVFYSK